MVTRIIGLELMVMRIHPYCAPAVKSEHGEEGAGPLKNFLDFTTEKLAFHFREVVK